MYVVICLMNRLVSRSDEWNVACPGRRRSDRADMMRQMSVILQFYLRVVEAEARVTFFSEAGRGIVQDVMPVGCGYITSLT